MKRLALVGLVGVVLLGALAWAAPGPIIDLIPRWEKGGLYVTPTGSHVVAANKVTRALGASATIDFTSSTVAPVISSSITVTGAQAGDPCFVGVPTAAGALNAQFECFVASADSVKVKFTPMNKAKGQVALTSGTPSTATATVAASSVCTCTPVGATAAIAAAGCATGVSSTTLTLTGPNTVTTTMTYDCAAPVDPASGTFYVRVLSSQ